MNFYNCECELIIREMIWKLFQTQFLVSWEIRWMHRSKPQLTKNVKKGKEIRNYIWFYWLCIVKKGRFFNQIQKHNNLIINTVLIHWVIYLNPTWSSIWNASQMAKVFHEIDYFGCMQYSNLFVTCRVNSKFLVVFIILRGHLNWKKALKFHLLVKIF